MDAIQFAAHLAASDAARIAAFERDSKKFPVGTKVRTADGATGVILPEKGKVGYGVTTLRIQFDGFVGRMVPAALTRI